MSESTQLGLGGVPGTPPPGLGASIGPYRLDRLLATGAMGSVYAGVDTRLNRPVAVKLLLAGLAHSPGFAARFEREAAVMARLESPHVIALYDHGRIDGWPYLVSQYAAGGDLGHLIARHRQLPGPLAAQICAQVADALAAAHSVGVIHRDVKPSNVLLRDERLDRPHAYLGDFGVAHTDASGLTQPGSIAGTWNYLAPERAAGDPGSLASDLYALGCLLYESLTGRPPYAGSDVEVALAHVSGPIPQLAGNDDFTRRANAILARLLAKDPAARPHRAAEVRDQLQLLSGRVEHFAPARVVPQRRARRPRRRAVLAGVSAGVLVAALAAGGVWWTTSGGDSPSADEPTKGPAITGDLDRDGRGDVVWGSGVGSIGLVNNSADSSENDLLLTSATDAFRAPRRITPGKGQLIGDVNGDGYADLVQVSGTSTTYQVTTNIDGQLGGNIRAPKHDEVLGAFAADLNGDGRDEVGLVTIGDGTELDFSDLPKDVKLRVIAIGLTDQGTWTPRQRWLQVPFDGDKYGTAVEAGDFDGDGHDDLLVGNSYGDIAEHLYLSDGSRLKASTAAPPTLDTSFDVTPTAADLDGDGTSELVVTAVSSLQVFGYGDDGWHEERSYRESLKTTGVDVYTDGTPALSDVNGDGRDDLVFPNIDIGGDHTSYTNTLTVAIAGKDSFTRESWKAPKASTVDSLFHPIRATAWIS
ncbi:MAG: protein kinase [Nocardioides sp.]|uniref:protein kinase domain-containing protein n=1 Tax=Nocardioides sp. TaxID=35761 RepID=UPI0039E2172F